MKQQDNQDGVTCFPLQAQPPRVESEIMRDWGEARQPVVSVCCATYNHFGYIEDAIRGILGQETTFPFEVIIRDDASTDGTTDITRNYAQQYPNIIRLTVNPENLFSKGVKPALAWPSLSRGKYIALCEGDDFWISPTKLQKQVDLLERHPDAVMSVARAETRQQDANGFQHLGTTALLEKKLLGFDEIHKTYFHTSTYVARADIYNDVIRQHWTGNVFFGDTALRAILVSLGPFVFLPEVVSVYRITGNGVWTSLSKEKQLEWECEATRKLTEILPGKHGRYQRDRLHSILKSLHRHHLRNRNYIKAARLFPSVFWRRLTRFPGSLKRKMHRKSGSPQT